MTPASMKARLTRLRIAGFRSLRDVSLALTDVTVLIGPNGAGKSNVLWALEMVRMIASGSLQLFVSERGGASYLLHYGPKETPAIDIQLIFQTDDQENGYEARLGYGADESLTFHSERVGYRGPLDDRWFWRNLGSGHRESLLNEPHSGTFGGKAVTVNRVKKLLRGINFYHFHDTSGRSPLRTRSYADSSGKTLRSDGSNLPAFLLGLKESEDEADRRAWARIVGLLQRVAPFISELLPSEDRRGSLLQWRDDQGAFFGPAHLSDGTLRALALLSALGQPDATLPQVSCIDEPELGLHPSALGVLCALIASVSAHHQVIVSTQSPIVLDHFEPGQVVVAERSKGSTTLRRLDEATLSSWLEEYSLSELYDKNILGGRP